MNAVTFAAAQSAFTAASGLSTFAGGFHTQQAPAGTNLPYLVLTTQADAENDTFTTDNSVGAIAFNVVSAIALGAGGDHTLVKWVKTTFHRQTVAVTVDSVDYKVTFFRTNGLSMPASAFAFQSTEVYQAQVWAV